MDSILNEVKDCDGIAGSSKLVDLHKDNFSSLPNGKIDPSDKVMSQNEALSPVEMKESPRKSESDTEAQADDDYIAAELEKVRNMTPEEAYAAKHQAYIKTRVAIWEAHDAYFKVKKEESQVRARVDSVKKYSRTELEKMWSPLTPSEALAEAFERYEAAKREEIAAQHTVNKSSRLVLAISEACEKRPVTDCEGRGNSCSN